MQIIEPSANFRFELQIEGISVGWFAECGGLTIEREVTPHQEGGLNDYVHQLPGRIKHQSLTLKKGMVGEELWQWLQEGMYDGKVKRTNVSVILYKTDRSVLRRWDLTDVYPSKWTGPTLKSDSRQISLETLEFSQTDSDSLIQRAETDEAVVEGAQAVGESEVDVHALAKEVYTLLRRELRLERERTGWRRR
jgi:phage tail-like protein